ncbi:toll/interleukin-1 receptor domain-containing protein [Streptomyces chartreusis]|uniref:toll/interleukin-1 receptor domain-containing protein n=1 Tax=Streptomyces chartreusis TaxID=1969 RepID=UPI003815F2D3
MTGEPVAFMSYAQFNDRHDHGWLTSFRKRLSGEVEALIGMPFPIFQDRESIEWGEHWESRIEQSLDAVTLFIPIVTPHFFTSVSCRKELGDFLQNERTRGRQDLVLPLYYVTADLLEDSGNTDEDATVLKSRQYYDLRGLRGEKPRSHAFEKGVRDVAQRLRRAFTQRSATGPGLAENRAVGGRALPPAMKEPSNDELGSWDGLVRVLRQTSFDASSWTALASSTALLVHQLSLTRPPHPTDDDVLSRYVGELERTLEAASRPSASPMQVRSACAYAAKTQGWLLQVLANSGRF